MRHSVIESRDSKHTHALFKTCENSRVWIIESYYSIGLLTVEVKLEQEFGQLNWTIDS